MNPASKPSARVGTGATADSPASGTPASAGHASDAGTSDGQDSADTRA